MRYTERGRERQRHRQREREKQAPCQEPDVGPDPGTPGLCPGPKTGAKPLSHPGIPNCDHSFTPKVALEYFLGNLVISAISRDKS